MYAPTGKLSKLCPFAFFIEALLHRHVWLNRWPLVIELKLQLLPFSEGGAKLQPSNQSWFRWQKSSQPTSSKSYLIKINSGMVERDLLWKSRCPNCFFHLGKSKGFRHSVLELRTETKSTCIINHNIMTAYSTNCYHCIYQLAPQ